VDKVGARENPETILEGSDESSGRPHLWCVRPPCCQTASCTIKSLTCNANTRDNSQWMGQRFYNVSTRLPTYSTL